MRWEFTQAEIQYAWEQMRWDRVPAPLVVRPEADSLDAWNATKQEIAERLPILQDPDLLPVLQTAADPDMSVMMVGARKYPIRAYGAVTTTIGVTMVQRPTDDRDVGGNIMVQVGTPMLISKVFAAVAGDQPPGKSPGMVESWERLRDEQPASWMVRDQPLVADHMHDLLTAPRIAHGHIEIRLDRHESRKRAPRYVSWFDVKDDGRYVYMRQHGDLHIDPCSPERFRQLIARLMGL